MRGNDYLDLSECFMHDQVLKLWPNGLASSCKILLVTWFGQGFGALALSLVKMKFAYVSLKDFYCLVT